jgi:hypothetical protein
MSSRKCFRRRSLPYGRGSEEQLRALRKRRLIKPRRIKLGRWWYRNLSRMAVRRFTSLRFAGTETFLGEADAQQFLTRFYRQTAVKTFNINHQANHG